MVLKKPPTKKPVRNKRGKKCVMVSVAQKLEVLTKKSSGVHGGVWHRTIYDVKYKAAEYKKLAAEAVSEKKLERRKSLRKPELPKLDSVIFKYIPVTSEH
ncbi:hypothetical protein Pmani_028516 [Petrolisthes manimaculis]|uniref:Uncharacterized protein n=1 Tax=Petrolisthes manimaculis TaxID=1843537 RepID=A0AAE1P0M9_9EUCA|nr:hypothetical protein Pmani_028516 [Petrolisthes manimaculis]